MNTTFTRNGSIINLLSVLAPRIYSFHDISHKVNVFLKKTKSIIHFHVVLHRVRCKYTPPCRSVVYANSIGLQFSRINIVGDYIIDCCRIPFLNVALLLAIHDVVSIHNTYVYLYCFRLHTFSKNEIILMSSDFIPKIKQSQKNQESTATTKRTMKCSVNNRICCR